MTLHSGDNMATDTKDVKDVKDVKDETPADTRDALEVLESEAKEWEKASQTTTTPNYTNIYIPNSVVADNLNSDRMPRSTVS